MRISLDTNLCMIKENPEDGPSCAATGRWYRDPTLPVHRTEITRFPHAVLEVKLSLQEGQTAPAWVQVRVAGARGRSGEEAGAVGKVGQTAPARLGAGVCCVARGQWARKGGKGPCGCQGVAGMEGVGKVGL